MANIKVALNNPRPVEFQPQLAMLGPHIPLFVLGWLVPVNILPSFLVENYYKLRILALVNVVNKMRILALLNTNLPI